MVQLITNLDIIYISLGKCLTEDISYNYVCYYKLIELIIIIKTLNTCTVDLEGFTSNFISQHK